MSEPTEESVIAPAFLAFVNGEVPLALNADAFTVVSVQKTAYTLANRCTALIGGKKDGVLTVTLTFSAGTTETNALEVARLFLRELLDQELRERIGEETRAIRSLILAQAFSRTNLVRQG